MSKKIPIPVMPKKESSEALNKYVQTMEKPKPEVPTKSMHFKIPAELHKRFKSECASSGRMMADVITDMIEGWLKNESKDRG